MPEIVRRPTSAVTVRAARLYASWLWPLAALFVLRVIAQPLALVLDVPYLPPFDAWHSGALPYGALVALQVAIIAVLSALAWRLGSGRVVPRRPLGIGVLVIGACYFAVMLARLAVGLTILQDHFWFARPVPTVFHLVLAGFLLVYGHFHFHHGGRQ